MPEGWKTSPNRNSKERLLRMKINKLNKGKTKKIKRRSTLFVLGTKHGILAKKLREVIKRMTGIV